MSWKGVVDAFGRVDEVVVVVVDVVVYVVRHGIQHGRSVVCTSWSWSVIVERNYVSRAKYK